MECQEKEEHGTEWTNEDLVTEVKRRQMNGEPTTDLMELLWKRNRGITISLSKRFYTAADRDDLAQESYFALLKAVAGYNPDRGHTFLTYYGTILLRHLNQVIGRYATAIRIPDWMQSQIVRYRRYVAEYEQSNGETPTAQEICNALCIKPNNLTELRRVMGLTDMASLDAQLAEDPESTLGDLIADPEGEQGIAGALDDVIHAQQKKIIWTTCDAWLTARQVDVLRLRYSEGMNYKQIGAKLGISAERARQIAADALSRLRESETVRETLLETDEEIYSRAMHRAYTGEGDYVATGNTEDLALKKIAKEEGVLRKKIRMMTPESADSKRLERMLTQRQLIDLLFYRSTGAEL